jgi:hypothetical protein
MSRMRGVDSFERLWSRRTTIEVPSGTTFDLLSLPDLVQAKKTQRDKDWPMIRRLARGSLNIAFLDYVTNHTSWGTYDGDAGGPNCFPCCCDVGVVCGGRSDDGRRREREGTRLDTARGAR